MSAAEKMKLWNEAFGHVTAGDVWLFVVVMVVLIAGVIYFWRDE